MSDSTILVGAPRNESNEHGVGAAYLYDLETGQYLNVIRHPEFDDSAFFALNASAIGSGFLLSDVAEQAGFPGSGTVWHFNEQGELLGSIFNPDPKNVLDFGSNGLALVESETIFVSGYVRGEVVDQGQVQQQTISSWIMSLDGTVLHEIENPTGDYFSEFGFNAARLRDQLVISADHEDVVKAGDTVSNSGAVYLYDLEGKLIEAIPNPDGEAGAWFGRSITPIGSDMFAVGAVLSSRTAPGAGAVYVYDFKGELLQTIENPEPHDNANFGEGISYSNGFLYVGAVGASGLIESGEIGRPGAVYQFQLTFPPLTADFNGDGTVDLSDFVILKDHFNLVGAKPEQGDADGDNDVDLDDFAILKDEFGETNIVPEPGGLLLMAACAAAVLGQGRGGSGARGR